MQSNGVNSRYLLNFGAAALTYVVARRYTQNNFALMSQGAVSFTAALAKSRFSKDLVGSDETYSFGSFLLIFGIGALGGLPWKVNALASAAFAFGSYFFRLEFGSSLVRRSDEKIPSKDRDAIRQRIIQTPLYVESFQNYDSAIPSREYISIFTHVHQILPDLYLGDYRAFLSIDPNFIERYKMVDEEMNFGVRWNDDVIRRTVIPYLDMKGCSEMGIGLVVSVTQFKPAPAVEKGDWSLFEPNLAGIERIQVLVDDEDTTWELLEPELDGIFQAIDRARGEGKPILIHCVKGACRSAAVMIAYLMNRYGVTYDQAYNYVKSIRHQVDMKSSWVGSAEKGTGLLGYQTKLSMQFDLKR